MKQLDKIYVPIIDLGVEDGGIQPACVWLKHDKTGGHPEYKGVVEYIRKDALLNWAKTKLSHMEEDFDVYTGQRIILRELIDKINSL